MSHAPQIGVLALQGAVAEHEQALSAAGAQVRRIRRTAELDGLDGLVIPGGESTAIARLAAPMGLMPAIRQRYEEGMAVFGTCAGLILTADAVADAEALAGFDRIGGLGVVVRRNAYGNQLASFEAELEVSGIADAERALPAVFIRAPIIEEITSGEVEVLAEAAGHPVVVRQGRMLAASFHPELTADFRLHQLFTELAAG